MLRIFGKALGVAAETILAARANYRLEPYVKLTARFGHRLQDELPAQPGRQ